MPLLLPSGTGKKGSSSMNYLRILCMSLLLLAGCQPSPSRQSEPTTFILVRHAEKADDGTRNPPLTEAGQQRAQALDRLFSQRPIAAVYSSDYSRTLETARPLASRNQLEIQLYEPHKEQLLLESLKKEYAGKTIAIVGHSNTIPAAVNLLLGEDRLQVLEESEYDKVFVVTVSPQGEAHLLTLQLDPPVATQ